MIAKVTYNVQTFFSQFEQELTSGVDEFDDYPSDYDDDGDENTSNEIIQKNDPLIKSFHNVKKAKEFKKYHVEYANKFQQIIEDDSEFAVRMLSLCQNQEEAELILTNKILSPKDDFLDGRLPFPILEGALIQNLLLMITLKNY